MVTELLSVVFLSFLNFQFFCYYSETYCCVKILKPWALNSSSLILLLFFEIFVTGVPSVDLWYSYCWIRNNANKEFNCVLVLTIRPIINLQSKSVLGFKKCSCAIFLEFFEVFRISKYLEFSEVFSMVSNIVSIISGV